MFHAFVSAAGLASPGAAALVLFGMMIGKRQTELRPGCRVRVRMEFGWGFTGELRRSDEEKIRVYDSTIDEVVRLDRQDVADISTIDDAPEIRRAAPRRRDRDGD